MKTTFFLPLFALVAQVAMAAMPPACLLHAVNIQDNPADLSSVCGSKNAVSVQSAIASMCSGTAVSAAQSAFIATCSSAGQKVAPYTASSSSGATRTGTFVYTTAVYNSSCSCTQTIVTSATGASNSLVGAASSSARSSGAAVSTAGAVPAAHYAQQQKMGGYAAAAIALVGAVAAL